jgi:hypothetical protein
VVRLLESRMVTRRRRISGRFQFRYRSYGMSLYVYDLLRGLSEILPSMLKLQKEAMTVLWHSMHLMSSANWLLYDTM